MNLKRSLLLVSSVSILAAVPAIFFAHPAVASNPLAVTVSNTPLPIQGTVNARQSGNWNVGVSGTVNVASMPNVNLTAGTAVAVSNQLDGNGNTSSLFTRDSDNPALHPYLGTCTVQQSALTVGCTTTPVPAGKTLVVEQVDEFVAVPSGQGTFHSMPLAATQHSSRSPLSGMMEPMIATWPISSPGCTTRQTA